MITLMALLTFSSVDEAAMAALREAKACSQPHRECGGVIYQTPEGFVYTPPITDNKSNSVDLWPAYKDHQHDTVADYHTHPCVGNKPLNNAFSSADVMVYKGFNLVGYMLSLCDGYVRRWASDDYEDDIEVDFHSGRKIFLTAGHIVGMIP
jgi:hypothetical protein